jgi:hypothetical protein
VDYLPDLPVKFSQLLAAILHALRRVFALQSIEAVQTTRRGVRFRPRLWDRELAESAEPGMVSLVAQGVMLEGRKWTPIPRPVRVPPPPVSPVATALLEPPRIVLGRTRMAPEIVEAAHRLSFDFARSVNETTAERLEGVYSEFRAGLVEWAQGGEAINELAKRVRKVIADPKRALTIARTEGRRTMEAGRMIAAKAASIRLGKRWVASPDACPRCLALAANRKPLELDEPFIVEGSGPYAVVMHPPLHPHCFCATAFVPL